MSEADYIGTYDTTGVGGGIWHHYQNITDVYDNVPEVVHQFPHAPVSADAQTTPTAEDQSVDPLGDAEVADYIPTAEDLFTPDVLVVEEVLETPAPVEPEPEVVAVVEEVPAVVEPEPVVVETPAPVKAPGTTKRTARRK